MGEGVVKTVGKGWMGEVKAGVDEDQELGMGSFGGRWPRAQKAGNKRLKGRKTRWWDCVEMIDIYAPVTIPVLTSFPSHRARCRIDVTSGFVQ